MLLGDGHLGGQLHLDGLHAPTPAPPSGSTPAAPTAAAGPTPTNRNGGTCDPDGCDFNSYSQGDLGSYGPGGTVNTGSVFTVVTQFVEDAGALSAIRRNYVQNGTVIANSESLVEANPGNELNDEFCKAQKAASGEEDVFNDKGGFAQFSEAVAGGMVLVKSLWDDHYANMLWLDSTYPIDSAADEVGKVRGSCGIDTGVPEGVEVSQVFDQVTFSYVAPEF